MRTRFLVLLSVVLVVGLLVPTGAWAKRITAAGSLAIIGSPGPSLSTNLVATLITANPGLEKTIVQQLPLPGPLFVAPFFVSEEKGNPGPDDIGTILLLTNPTTEKVTVRLTFYNLDGTVLASTQPMDLAPHETRVIRISDLLP